MKKKHFKENINTNICQNKNFFIKLNVIKVILVKNLL